MYIARAVWGEKRRRTKATKARRQNQRYVRQAGR